MPGIVPQSTLEQIRAASDIVEIIGASVPLKRAGSGFVGLCPFHKEKTPSFNVIPHKQIFHCFGCHKGGDVFSWIREYEGVGFAEAVHRLAERARIPLNLENDPHAGEKRFLKDTLLSLHEQITKRWQNALANEACGQPARDYLASRGVTAEAVQRFRLGFAPDAWDDTLNWSRSKGFEPALVEQGGLILKRDGSEGYYDRFRGRLMFPIADEQGRIIAFSGRVLDPDAKAAKYVNSPETPIFTKGKVFYGLDQSKRAILDSKRAILCEGQLDLIACHTAGVTNVVAPQGTAFTADHARILRRYTEEVVLCFDGDAAGQSAILRALDGILAAGLAARVAVIPAPHDPDSYIKAHGAEAFQQLVEKSEGFFDFMLKRLHAAHAGEGDRGRLALVRGMAEAVRKTGNAVLIDTYAQKTAQLLDVSAESVRAEFRKAGRQDRMPSPREDVLEPEDHAEPEQALSIAEARLLALLFTQDELTPYAAVHVQKDWIAHPGLRQLMERRLALHESGRWCGLAAFLEGVSAPGLRSLLTQAAANSRPPINPAKEFQGVLQTLRNAHIERQLVLLRRRLGEGVVLGSEEHANILAEMTSLRALKVSSLPAP